MQLNFFTNDIPVTYWLTCQLLFNFIFEQNVLKGVLNKYKIMCLWGFFGTRWEAKLNYPHVRDFTNSLRIPQC